MLNQLKLQNLTKNLTQAALAQKYKWQAQTDAIYQNLPC